MLQGAVKKNKSGTYFLRHGVLSIFFEHRPSATSFSRQSQFPCLTAFISKRQFVGRDVPHLRSKLGRMLQDYSLVSN